MTSTVFSGGILRFDHRLEGTINDEWVHRGAGVPLRDCERVLAAASVAKRTDGDPTSSPRRDRREPERVDSLRENPPIFAARKDRRAPPTPKREGRSQHLECFVSPPTQERTQRCSRPGT